MSNKISLFSHGAVALGSAGFMLVALAVMAALPIEGAWLGFALLFVGGFAWLHGQIERIAEHMTQREDAAFAFGKISAVHAHDRHGSHDRV